MRFIVTIDGPAGAGKSTVARELAKRLGFVFVDTGALYRAVGFGARLRGIPFTNGAALGTLARDASIEIKAGSSGQKIYLDGTDVTSEIRTPEAAMGASAVSAVPEVREGLLGLQRRLAGRGGAVAEGRDTGTVVFPDADVKFYLDASPEIRARRRFDELSAKGMSVEFERILAETIQRDRNDSTRAVAPLACPAGAVRVDTDGMNAGQVLDFMETEVRRRMSRP
jgi:cytidylate kinase